MFFTIVGQQDDVCKWPIAAILKVSYRKLKFNNQVNRIPQKIALIGHFRQREYVTINFRMGNKSCTEIYISQTIT